MLVPFLDELASGVVPAASPAIAADFGVDPGRSAGALLAAFAALAIVLEPALLRVSERVRVRRWMVGALVALAAISIAIGIAPTFLALAAAVAAYGPASGCAVAVAEGTLVEATPHARERVLARLGIAATIGDLAVPAMLFALDRIGAGWREAQLVPAVVAIALATVVASSRALDRRPAGDHDGEDDEPTPTWREVLGNRALLGWSLAGALTNLLDEVVVAFAAVHVHAQVSGDEGDVALAIFSWIAGACVGLAVLDRALERIAPDRALAIASALSIAPFVVLFVTRDLPVACGALAVLGALAATFHPIVKARAYDALPGHPGLVNAMASLIAPVDLVAPLALAAIAELLGASAPIAVLALVPVVMLAIALRRR